MGESHSDHAFVFSPTPDFKEWFSFGASQDHEVEVDLGWLSRKLDHLATYWWALCPVASLGMWSVTTDECSSASTLSLRSRLPNLTRSQARTDARCVMARKFRSYWRGGYHRRALVLSGHPDPAALPSLRRRW